jgi:hypothetical protein
MRRGSLVFYFGTEQYCLGKEQDSGCLIKMVEKSGLSWAYLIGGPNHNPPCWTGILIQKLNTLLKLTVQCIPASFFVRFTKENKISFYVHETLPANKYANNSSSTMILKYLSIQEDR